jgi:hypothetical protein
MALKPLQTSGLPLGQYDMLDTDMSSIKGGEVVTLTTVSVPSSDLAAADAFDGYISVGPKRPVVTRTLTSSTRPLMLADDGVVGYGTMFGSIVGGTVGQTSYGPNSTIASGDLLGPTTMKGSGKVSLWATPGHFAVSLDAVDTTALTGLTITNPTLTAGSALYYTTGGLLTPISTNSTKVGIFFEFVPSGSMVTTPNHLVGSLSAPNGQLGTSSRVYSHAVFQFDPPVA